MRKIIAGMLLFVFISGNCFAEKLNEKWLLTAYCACEKCCGKKPNNPAYGLMASGKKVYDGAVACNWLPFKTKLLIGGKIYTVEDRGAKSLFGDKNNHIKHIDIYMPSHNEALKWGKKYMSVTIINN
jgi:3D (Asp-Asp-Asp) domain-containing protein